MVRRGNRSIGASPCRSRRQDPASQARYGRTGRAGAGRVGYAGGIFERADYEFLVAPEGGAVRGRLLAACLWAGLLLSVAAPSALAQDSKEQEAPAPDQMKWK